MVTSDTLYVKGLKKKNLHLNTGVIEATIQVPQIITKGQHAVTYIT